MGLPCTFAFARKAGVKTDNDAVRKAVRETPPLVLFGSYNERMYLAEAGGRAIYIPASFPGAVIRRAHRHAVHGLCRRDLSGAGSLQRAVRRAVPHPAARQPISTGSSRRRRGCTKSCPGATRRKALLDEVLEAQPVLVRISAAKRLRDAAERGARRAGEDVVTTDFVAKARSVLMGNPA